MNEQNKKEIKWFNELPSDVIFLREEIFMREQGFSDEFDDIDKIAKHLCIYINNEPAATGRLFFKNDRCIFGRIAVSKHFRKQNLGSLVVNALCEKAIELNASTVYLSAQVNAAPFYAKLGFLETGEHYLDESCPHVDMYKNLK